MRMMGIGNAGREVVFRIRNPQARHILIGLVWVALEIEQNLSQQLACLRVVDELRLEAGENVDRFLHRQGAMRMAWIARRKGRLNQAARERYERQCRTGGWQDQQVAAIDSRSSFDICIGGVVANIHCSSRLDGSSPALRN